MVGDTQPTDFATTLSGFDTGCDGDPDAFVAKLNAAASALDYATFLGGSERDGGSGIAVDRNGAAYVAGETYSSGFPTTPGAFDTSFKGASDACVVKLAMGPCVCVYLAPDAPEPLSQRMASPPSATWVTDRALGESRGSTISRLSRPAGYS